MRKRKTLRIVYAWMLIVSMVLQQGAVVSAADLGMQTETETQTQAGTEETAAETQQSESESGAETEAAEMTETETETTADTESESQSEETEPVSETDPDTAAETEEEAAKKPKADNPEGDELKVEVANESGVFQDVSTLPGNEVEFPLSNKTRQMNIFARFGSQGTPGDRTVEVTIPQGYVIKEFSAKSGTEPIDGVAFGSLAPEPDGKLASSVLTGIIDPDWTKQKITGYSGRATAREPAVRTYGGKILYTFNPNIDYIELTLTFGVQQEILPHNNTETVISTPVKVELVNSSRILKESFTTRVTEIAVPGLLTKTVQAEASVDTPVIDFVTGVGAGIHHTLTGEQNHLAEEFVYSVSYPKGVTFTGFRDVYAGVGAVNSDSYTGPHLTVVNDPVGRKVTFTYTNITAAHTSGSAIECYWNLDINNSDLVTSPWNGTAFSVLFPTTLTGTSGLQADNSQNYVSSTVNMRANVRPIGWEIILTPMDSSRRDLGMSYPYDYLLGGIRVVNSGPSVAENLKYHWQFDESLRVRGLSFPGMSGNFVRNVKATVKKADGSTKIREAIGPFDPSGNRNVGAVINSNALGLEADEYIIEVTAEQDSLNAESYNLAYTYSGGCYYGRFQNGESGNATLTISDQNDNVLVSETHRPEFAWNETAAGWTTSSVEKVVSDGSDSYYPGDKARFTSVYDAGSNIRQNNDIVDPTIIISLPAGIVLDPNSVEAVSDSGKHLGASFPLELKSMETISDGGVDWKVYRYSSKSYGEMIAQAHNMYVNTGEQRKITVNFEASILTSCQAYGGIPMSKLVLWDLGQSAISSTASINNTVEDSANRSGKGTDYVLAAGTTSGNMYVTLRPGFNVSLGIRTKDSGSDFFTYNGEENTIAPLKAGSSAEVYLHYANTTKGIHYKGTEIYLPIPKKGIEYDGYFTNVSDNPFSGGDIRHAEFDMSLTKAIELEGFDVEYTTDTTGDVEDLSGSSGDGWTPVEYTWENESAITDWAKVTMVRFKANKDIPAANDDGTQGTGNTTFEIKIDNGAALEEQNFWRSFQKGWTTPEGLGSWVFGSVLAAETSKAGILGRIFNDKNANGIMDAGEEYDNTAGKITALLTGSTITPTTLTVNPDGTFGTEADYSLKAGTYTVTIANGDSMMDFTPVTSTTQSDNTVWYMDFPQGNIAEDQSRATFEFTVAKGSSLDEEYVGVGLKQASKVTYKAGTGVTFTDVEEYVSYNKTPAGAPSLDPSKVIPGYDSTKQSWKIDKDVVLTDGTTIAANTAMSRDDLFKIKVTEDLVATVDLPLVDYKITYKLNGGTVTGSNPATYRVTSPEFTLVNPDREGYDFAGWTGNGTTTPTTTMKVATGTTGNLEFTAHWTAKTYNITYLLNGGTVTGNPATYTIETADFTLNNPTRAGYDFKGWTGNGVTTPTTTMTVTKGTTGNLEFTANWEASGYDITYKLNGGTVTGNPDSYKITTPTFTLKNPIRDGYDFAGWTGNGINTPELTMAVVTGTTGDLEFTAHWTKKTYNITYDLAGGTATGSNPSTYDVDTATFTLSNPTRNGYTFAGWTRNGVGSPQITTTVTKGTTGNLSFKAHWTESNYTIKYKLDGGTVSGNPDSYKITTPTFTLKNPTKPGYKFDGWTKTDGDTPALLMAVVTGTTGNLEFTAHWTKETYNITYDLDGGTATGSNPVTYAVDTATFTLSNPTKSGHTFVGWTGNGHSSPQNPMTVTKGTTGDLSFKAHWTSDDYTINYNLDGGTATGNNPNGYKVTTPTFTLSNPTKLGYEFKGWTGNGQSTPVMTMSVVTGTTGNLEFTAHWTRNTYNISYNLDGGTATGSNPATYTVDTPTFTLSNPTKDGYKFTGWTGTGLTFATGTVTVATGTTGHLSFTANWEILDYTISYDLDGGTATGNNPTGYRVTTPTFTLSNPTREGYEFKGWTGNGKVNPEKTMAVVIGTTGDLEFTAHWEKLTYNISYDLDGGTPTGTNPTTYAVDTETFTLSNPTKDGYVFDGWTGTGYTTATKAVTITKGTTGHLSFKAHWTAVDYTISYDLDGGTATGNNPTGYKVTTPTFTLSNPTKTGYDFAGWTGNGYTAPTITMSVITGTTGDLSFKANWVPTSYTINYNLDGGKATGNNPVTYNIETADFTLSNPTRDGHTFTGWTGNGITVPNKAMTVTKGTIGNLTFTANWSINSYNITVTVVGDTGGAAMAVPGVVNYNGGSLITAIPETGYELDYMKVNGAAVTPVAAGALITYALSGIQENKTVEVKFKPITYKVEYHAGAGTGTTQSDTMTYNTAAALTTFADLGFAAPAGYHFEGWGTTAAAATTSYSDGESVINLTGTKDAVIKLYAIYTEDSNITITYTTADPVMGNVSRKTESLAPATGAAEGSIAAANSGYMFLYWTDSSDTKVGYEAAFVPEKSGGLNVAESYTAHFAKAGEVGGKGMIGANDFSYAVKDADGNTAPAITEADAIRLAKVQVSGYQHGTQIPQKLEDATADADQLEAINEAITAGTKGVFDLTFYTGDYSETPEQGDKVTIKVTLTGKGVLEPDGSIGASDFPYGVKRPDGSEAENADLTKERAKALAQVWASDADGDFYSEPIDVDQAQLDRINLAKHEWYIMAEKYTGDTAFALTFTSAEGKKITIEVKLFTRTDPGNKDKNVLSANDFAHDVIDGAITAQNVKDLAKVYWEDYYGNALDGDKITVDETQLALINEKIKARELGAYPIAFSTPDGLKTTVNAILIGTVINAQEATHYIQDGALTGPALKQLLSVTAFDPAGQPIDLSQLAISAEQLAKINSSIEARTEGSEAVTLTAPDGTSITTKLNLLLRKASVNVTKTADDTKAPLVGAKLQILDVDSKVVKEWISADQAVLHENILIAGDTYTLREKEAPSGYMLAKDMIFTANPDGTALDLTMEDQKQPVGQGAEVEVTKYVMYEGRFRSMNFSFYAALFYDEACTQRATEVKELKLEKSYTTSARFSNLPEGTYYLAETDQDGNVIDVNSETTMFTNEIDKKQLILGGTTLQERAVIINHIKDSGKANLLEDDGAVVIDKRVLENGKAKKVSETFYFALFSDEEMTNAVYLESLKLSKESSAKLRFEDLPYGTYYVAETDENANPVGSKFKYEVKMDRQTVSLSEANKEVTVKIINQTGDSNGGNDGGDDDKDKKPATKVTRTTRLVTSGGVKTGDSSNILVYILLLGAAAIVIFSISRRRKDRHTR